MILHSRWEERAALLTLSRSNERQLCHPEAIDKVMSGEALDEIIDAILAEDEAARLAAIEA